ncbi:hypothetical protein RB213_010893, partial [Colletotrichum asianum]
TSSTIGQCACLKVRNNFSKLQSNCLFSLANHQFPPIISFFATRHLVWTLLSCRCLRLPLHLSSPARPNTSLGHLRPAATTPNPIRNSHSWGIRMHTGYGAAAQQQEHQQQQQHFCGGRVLNP